MEKNKTAIQQMIDFINDINNNDKSEFNYYYDYIIGKLNELLEVEKQQISDAYSQGDKDGYPDGSYTTGEEYYNQTYGSGVLTEGSVTVSEKGGAVTSSQTEISDEEIEQEAHIQYPVNLQPNGRTLAGGRYDIDINYSERNAYILSAKWMRDKILNK